MYAHQLIETISNSSPSSDLYKNKGLANACINLIQNSQKFYFGKIGDLLDLFDGQYNDTPMFSHELAEDAFLPYETCTLMFDGSLYLKTVSKVAIIAFTEQEGDEISLFVWFGFKNKDWGLFPVLITIKGILDKTKTSQMVLNPMFDDVKFPNNFDDSAEGFTVKMSMKIVNYFMMLLNCKNITTEDNPPPAKLNKKRQKKGKQPLFTYKTLVIKPTGKKQEAQEAQGLWENRVHLCRGHFKTYTEDKPLFGRITGRYWWQPSVRGNKKKGVVMKDYKVETEEAT